MKRTSFRDVEVVHVRKKPPTSFGDFLRLYREEAGLDVFKLAWDTGSGVLEIEAIEKGTKLPTEAQLELLLNRLKPHMRGKLRELWEAEWSP